MSDPVFLHRLDSIVAELVTVGHRLTAIEGRLGLVELKGTEIMSAMDNVTTALNALNDKLNLMFADFADLQAKANAAASNSNDAAVQAVADQINGMVARVGSVTDPIAQAQAAATAAGSTVTAAPAATPVTDPTAGASAAA